jgi:threonylcarbamoyladenosine tRNA methylthiotransferase MtaB
MSLDTAADTKRRTEVLSFGCRLNAFEAEVMRGHATRAALTDTIIINTCAVTTEAERQARQAIRRARRDNPDATIVVTGCAAQINPEAFAQMPEADHVIGNIDKLKSETFVEVQQGCDHRCTFCIIPFGRGPSRSAPIGDIVAQTEKLVAAGYREVVLTGVDLTAYGADLPGNPALGQMVRRLLNCVPTLTRLRLSSLDVAEVDDELFRLITTEPRIMPHLHLSLQAGDDMILKRMKRRHTRAQAIAFCAAVRAARPDVVFGADLIAGFPTETDAMFESSLALIEDAGLTWLHVFPYSARPGTPAAKMPALSGDLVRARAKALRAAGEVARDHFLVSCIGQNEEVLVEQPGLGRTQRYAHVAISGTAAVGDVVSAEIAEARDGRLEGRVL